MLVLQRMLKRGVDTLKMEDYQILYCEEGLATGTELEGLTIMSSAEHFVRPQALYALQSGCKRETHSPFQKASVICWPDGRAAHL